MANNPKLEIEVGETVLAEFPNPEPHTGQGNFGPWFLWTVTVSGSEFSLFAGETPSKTSPSFDQIDSALAVNTKILITHMAATTWQVEAADGTAQPTAEPPSSAGATPLARATQKPTASSQASSYEDVVDLLARNMSDARKVVDEFGKGLDGDTVGAVERMAIFLAIHCDKKGITLEDINSNDDLPF